MSITYEERIDAIEREFRSDRLSSLRFRMLFAVYVVTCVVPDFRSIFNSMNVELPWTTKSLLAAGDIFQDWWFLMFPAGWIAWRLIEERFLKKASVFQLRLMTHMFLVLLFGMGLALYMPMLKLINNVG